MIASHDAEEIGPKIHVFSIPMFDARLTRSVVPAGTRRIVNLSPSVKTLGYLRVREHTPGVDFRIDLLQRFVIALVPEGTLRVSATAEPGKLFIFYDRSMR